MQLKKLFITDHPNGYKRMIAQPVVSQFMEKLLDSEAYKIREREIRVSIDQVPSESEYRKFLNIIRNQRGVSPGAVREIEQGYGKYVVGVKYPMKSILS